MSPTNDRRPPLKKQHASSARHSEPEPVAMITQLPLLLALIALWLVLWRSVAPLTVITGIVMSVLVVRVFYLPPVLLSGRLSLWYLFVLGLKTLWWLIESNVQMAWIAIRPRPVPKSSVLAVRLRTHSDWLLTVCAEINMLVPGSVVVEVDRMRSILYLHVLDGDNDDKVLIARAKSLEIEDSVVLALGNRGDIAAINQWRRERDQPPLLATRRQREYEAAVEAKREQREREWEGAL